LIGPRAFQAHPRERFTFDICTGNSFKNRDEGFFFKPTPSSSRRFTRERFTFDICTGNSLKTRDEGFFFKPTSHHHADSRVSIKTMMMMIIIMVFVKGSLLIGLFFQAHRG